MARRKLVLFIGRTDPHMGYKKCIELCNKNNWKLIFALGDKINVSKLIKKADIIFTTGYLSILEAYLARKKVVWAWDSPLKEDYIKMHPMYGKSLKQAHVWARQQTWGKLAGIYEKLWQK